MHNVIVLLFLQKSDFFLGTDLGYLSCQACMVIAAMYIIFLTTQLIKLIMSCKAPRIKLGVLNMTICFDRPRSKSPLTIEIFESPLKTQQVPQFIPRYSSQRRKPPSPQNDGRMSPYQNYRNQKNQSIRYFRGQEEIARSNCQKIAGFCPINKTVQLEINDKTEESQHTYTPNNFVNDNHLKMVFNKKHLRNSIDLHQEKIKTHERLTLNFKTNPQENLKTIFTVRAAETSQRNRLMLRKQVKSDRCANFSNKFSFSDRRSRQNQRFPLKQGEIKRIRPWSTSKNWQSKMGMYESDILINHDSLQIQAK